MAASRLFSDGVPFVVVGHSLGTWIAFEVASLMRERGLPLPKAAFLSAFPAPDCPEDKRPWKVSGPVKRGNAAAFHRRNLVLGESRIPVLTRLRPSQRQRDLDDPLFKEECRGCGHPSAFSHRRRPLPQPCATPLLRLNTHASIVKW